MCGKLVATALTTTGCAPSGCGIHVCVDYRHCMTLPCTWQWAWRCGRGPGGVSALQPSCCQSWPSVGFRSVLLIQQPLVPLPHRLEPLGLPCPLQTPAIAQLMIEVIKQQQEREKREKQKKDQADKAAGAMDCLAAGRPAGRAATRSRWIPLRTATQRCRWCSRYNRSATCRACGRGMARATCNREPAWVVKHDADGGCGLRGCCCGTMRREKGGGRGGGQAAQHAAVGAGIQPDAAAGEPRLQPGGCVGGGYSQVWVGGLRYSQVWVYGTCAWLAGLGNFLHNQVLCVAFAARWGRGPTGGRGHGA